MERNVLLDLLAALVPAAERERLIYRRGADPALVSLLLGFGELFVGSRLLLGNALASFEAMSNTLATHVMENVDPRALDSFEAKWAMTGSGPIVWLTWALHPLTWLLASIPLVGLARLTAFAVNRDVVGEPLVWGALRAGQGVARLGRALRARLRFGPVRPDRLLREPGCDLLVLSARPKPEWNERVTLEIGDSFYRLQRVEERPDRGWRAWAFILREAEPNEVFRGLIRYVPPGPEGPPLSR
jgi:hypothetical protein